MKILLNDLHAAITRSIVTPIPTHLQPSPPSHTMPLSPCNKKPMSVSTNRRGKHESTSQDPKHDSSGSKDAIMDKHDNSGSDQMITEYTAKDAPTIIPRDPKNNSYVSNATMTYRRDRFGSDPTITEYTAKDAPAVATFDVNTKLSHYQGNRQSTDMNNDGRVDSGNKTEILCTRYTDIKNPYKQQLPLCNTEDPSRISSTNPIEK